MYVRHSIAEQRARGWSRLRSHKTTLPIFAHFPMRGIARTGLTPIDQQETTNQPQPRVCCVLVP